MVPWETGVGEAEHPVTIPTRSSRLQCQECETTAEPRPQSLESLPSATAGKKHSQLPPSVCLTADLREITCF